MTETLNITQWHNYVTDDNIGSSINDNINYVLDIKPHIRYDTEEEDNTV